MRIDIMTLFPETVHAVLHESVIGRAANNGTVEINCVQIRDYTENKQRQVDDYPYGGGFGCIMYAQPLKSCLDNIMSTAQNLKSRVIYMTPQGAPYTEETAKRLVRDYDHLVLVCGHYEGIDERFIEKCVDEEISIGDFVLSGGEIAAMAVADSVCRLVPGVLADEQCYTGDSHWDGLLEYPQYTRPEVWEGLKVPDVLLEGNQARIDAWRRKQQLIRTKEKRPDMFEKLALSEKELASVEKNIKGEVDYRLAGPEDMDAILSIVDDAKALLKSRHIDQWQGEYPAKADFEEDLANQRCYVITVDGETAAFFTLSSEPEPCYAAITDGKWSSEEPYVTLHRAAVAGKYRGSGLSAMLFKFTEKIATEKGFRYIRVDTHKKNKAMQRCIRDAGFRYRGNVQIACEPGHETLRYAFEKKLKKIE